MPVTPSLRHTRIAVILSSVLKTLLFLRNNHIPLHQSSNFVLFPSNHSGSGTIFFSIAACLLSFVIASAGAVDISSSDHSYVSSEVLFVICKDPSLSDSVSGVVHTGVEVHRMDSEMSRLVERPWLQLMCCAVCLPHGRNFR